LATDVDSDEIVVLKLPSVDLRDDEDYLKRFMLEEWISRRVESPYVLKAPKTVRPRKYLYSVAEWIDGQTLAQWIIDNPQPDVDVVRGLISQIGAGVRAFHRKEMVHQDLRPANVMISRAGTVKIIDFGSARVAGVSDVVDVDHADGVLGTAQFTAPEIYLGAEGTAQSDIYSLAAMTYFMLTGHLPYGTQVSGARTKLMQTKLSYRPAYLARESIPLWVDAALEKALKVNPAHRYVEVSEFLEDLQRPNPQFSRAAAPSLLDRNPNLFWKLLTTLFGVASLVMALLLLQKR
jgi:serine/threonine protein kinase